MSVEEAKQLLTAEKAYALENGATMKGTQVLRGEIVEIPSAYSADYKNITVNIKVGERIIQCFRLKGGEDLKVGDVITVTGTIKNYNGTIEFDKGCTYVKYPFQMANNRESAERNIKLQFSKRSCHFTFSLKEFYINGATLPFFPISELNAMRNEIAEIASRKLEDLRILEKRQEEEREVARRARRDSYIKGIRNGEENQIFYL